MCACGSGVRREPQQAAANPGDPAPQSREADRVSVAFPQRPRRGRPIQRREGVLDKTDQGDEAQRRRLLLARLHGAPLKHFHVQASVNSAGSFVQ